MLAIILQAAPVVAETHGKAELIGAATLVLTNVGALLGAHLRGRGSGETLTRIEQKLDVIVETQHAHDKRISEVSAHVIGPDGKNGLRARVLALEERT